MAWAAADALGQEDAQRLLAASNGSEGRAAGYEHQRIEVALDRSYMSTHHLAAYALEHLFHVFDRRLWQDSMA